MWVLLSKSHKYFFYISWALQPFFYIWQKLFYFFLYPQISRLLKHFWSDFQNWNLVGKGRNGPLKYIIYRYIYIKREIETFSDKQSRSTKLSENFWTKSSFDEMTYIKNIPRVYTICIIIWTILSNFIKWWLNLFTREKTLRLYITDLSYIFFY